MSEAGRILILAGDGIGPEVMDEVKRVLGWFARHGTEIAYEEDLVGGAAYDRHGVPLAPATLERARTIGTVMFGAVGGPRYSDVPFDVRPEAGLLALRQELGLFANLRPALVFPALAAASALKPELVEGLDIMIVRELTGGVYFGQPKEITSLPDGQERAVDTQLYTTSEIERIARVAFELARKRSNKVASAEKSNVMKSGVLWKKTVQRIHDAEFADVELSHILADNCAMQLVRQPKQFDVIVTDNLFGDILSDVAAMLTGSLGMLPSASLGAPDAAGRRKGMYEPVHGSAPDIAGQGIANPLACISSFSMLLRYSFDRGAEADLVDAAIAKVLADGYRTADLAAAGETRLSTGEMGSRILSELDRLAA